jgi:hypothetical protein
MGEVSLDVMAGQSLYLKFEVQREDLSNLMEALRRRGVVSATTLSTNHETDDCDPRIGQAKFLR